MIKRLILVLTLTALLASTAQAVSINRGKRGRSYLRHSMLRSMLKYDKAKIYDEYGYPVHRLRVYSFGEVKEHWTYYEAGKEFIFNEDSKLIKVNNFPPEDRRERFRSSYPELN